MEYRVYHLGVLNQKSKVHMEAIAACLDLFHFSHLSWEKEALKTNKTKQKNTQ